MDIDNLVSTAKEAGGKSASWFRHWQFGNKQQLAFLEDLYLLINDGIPANRAIEMLGQVTSGLSQQVARSLTDKISSGQTLADGMDEWFSPSVVEIIRVGEAGGALAQTMKSAINALSQRGAAMGGFVSALAYPLIVLTIASGVIVYLDTSVFVQFRAIKPESEWPEAGRRLVGVAKWIRSWWWTVIVAIIVITITLSQLMAKYTGPLRSTLDIYPPFSFYRRLVAARLLETLGLLVSNGVVFKSAIKVMQYQANPYFKYHLENMEHLLSMGKSNIADVLSTGLVSRDDLMRLRVMAEVKGFEHGLVRMGVKGAIEANETMKKIAKLIGGFFLIMGGALIIIILQGIYLTGMAMGS